MRPSFCVTFVSAVVAAALLVVPSLRAEESGPIPSAALMRDQSNAMRDLDEMVKELAPFDPMVVASRIALLIETSMWLRAAFPEEAKGRNDPKSRYEASPKVWETREDFDARAQKLIEAVRAAAPKVTSLAALRASLPTIGEACGNCHKVYRIER